MTRSHHHLQGELLCPYHLQCQRSPSPQARHRWRCRRRCHAAAAADTLPLTLTATPASASTTLGGCTVTHVRPDRVGTRLGGLPIIRYRTVTCAKDHIVQIRDQRWEYDGPVSVANVSSTARTPTYRRSRQGPPALSPPETS
jgi:hypothetical protein